MNPFKYGSIVTGKDFCGRNDLLKKIIDLLTDLQLKLDPRLGRQANQLMFKVWSFHLPLPVAVQTQCFRKELRKTFLLPSSVYPALKNLVLSILLLKEKGTGKYLIMKYLTRLGRRHLLLRKRLNILRSPKLPWGDGSKQEKCNSKDLEEILYLIPMSLRYLRREIRVIILISDCLAGMKAAF